jgi:hypothetical protein
MVVLFSISRRTSDRVIDTSCPLIFEEPQSTAGRLALHGHRPSNMFALGLAAGMKGVWTEPRRRKHLLRRALQPFPDALPA